MPRTELQIHISDRGVVPVERIELPTFGLQNRCSTAELNRPIESDQWPTGILIDSADHWRLEYQTCPQRAITGKAISAAKSSYEKGGPAAAFSSFFTSCDPLSKGTSVRRGRD